MPDGKLICIMGIDGAGKTTLAKNLVQSLRQSGVPAVYVYSKYVPVLMRPAIRLGNRIFLRKHSIDRDYQAYSAHKQSTTSRFPRLSKAYRKLVDSEYSLQILLKVTSRLKAGKVVVLDRYVYDTIVTDLAVDFNLTPADIERELSRMFASYPKPDLTLFVDLPEAVALARKTDVPDVGYLQDRRRLYRTMASTFQFPHLDGTKTPDAVAKDALHLSLPLVGR